MSELPPAGDGPSTDLRPSLASARLGGGIGIVLAGAAALGVVTFGVLSAKRVHGVPKAEIAAVGAAVAPAPPPPPDLLLTEAAARSGPLAVTAPAIQPPPAAVVAPLPPAPISVVAAPDPEAASRKAPSLVVDLGDGPQATTGSGSPGAASPAGATGSAAGSAAARAGGAPGGPPGPAGLNNDEQFAERVGAAEPERSRATMLRNTPQMIPQGAMIPGVMETALNSDLPGYARAVVSRDVRGFDGSIVLIPRGSRVIGQYKSAVAQGQSRAFIIWTRIIRPDGASIQIASSGTDPLGRAGLDGTVDRHFFERFGGAILLSVINAGVTSLSRAPSTQVVIGSSTEATSLGASVLQPAAIPPTIKVPQGAPIRIFVARDLDFSTVGNAK